MAEPRIDENGLPVYAPGDYDYVRVVDRSTGASRNALAPEVTAAARAISEALDGIVADAREDIDAIIRDLGYLAPVPYASGLNVNDIKFTVSYNGDVYAPKPELVPFTTGAWDPDQWNVIQGDVNLRSDLADPTGGAGLVAFLQSGTGAVQRTIAAKLRDQVSLLDFIPASAHAAIRAGTSSYDCRADFQRAVDHCVQTGRALYIPGGTYIIDVAPAAVGTPVYLSNLTAAGQGLHMYGEGRGKTIIKEKAGSTALAGRFTKMFYFLATTPYAAGSFSFSDITFDKNGVSNGAPPTTFGWEQAHILSWAGNGTPSIDAITFERCEFKDKVGACINLSSSNTVDIRSIVVRDVQSTDHPGIIENGGPFGHRGCIEFGMNCDSISVTDVTALYSQIEPVIASSSTNRRHSRISDSNINTLQFTDSGGFSWLDVSNVTCRDQLLVLGLRAKIINSTFKVVSNTYANYSMFVDNCEVRLIYNSSLGTITPWAIGRTATIPFNGEARVSNTSIVIDSDDPGITPTGYALTAASNPIDSYRRRFSNVTFDPRIERCVNAYQNGAWRFDNCFFACRSYTMDVGGNGANASDVEINHCNFDGVLGAKMRIQRQNDLWRLRITGTYLASEWSYSLLGSGALDTTYTIHPRFVGTVAPSGSWVHGDVVWNSAPAASGSIGWVKTDTSSTSGTWKSFGAIAS